MSCRIFRWAVLVAVSVLLSDAVQAADKYTGGSITWDTNTSQVWGNATGGPYNTAMWANYDRAIFEGAGGGTVTLSNPYANWLVFSADGYTLTGSTLNMGDPGGKDNFRVGSGVTAIINSDIYQQYATAIQKAGPGTLVFNGTVTSTNSNTRVEGGTLEIAGGTTTVSSTWLADSGGTTGTLAVTGGTFISGGGTISTRGNGTLDVSAGSATFTGGLSLGHTAGTATRTATVNLSGGSLAVTGGNLVLANDNVCSGIFNQTGGAFNMTGGGNMMLGNWGAATQEVNVSGGTFTGAHTGTTYLGVRSTASLNVSGTGQVTLPSIRVGHSGTSNATGIVNLDGGSLTVGSIVMTTGRGHTSTVNLNGGTLSPSASTTTFMQGLTSANVEAGGAVIDTNGFDITIAQPLLDAGGGLTKDGAGTLTLTAQNTYTGDTVINGGTLVMDTPNFYTYQGGDIDINNGSTFKVTRSGGANRYDFVGKTFTFDGNGGGTIDTSSSVNFVFWNPGNTFVTSGGAQNTIIGASGFNVNNGVTATFDVAIGDDPVDLKMTGPIKNTGAILKKGDGVMELTAASSYSGGTTVEAGTLLVNNTTGSGTGTGAVTLTGGTLAGDGTIDGGVDIQGAAAVSPGNDAVGTLAVGGTYDQTGTMIVDIAGLTQGTEHDWLDVSGDSTIDGLVSIILDDFQPQTYDFFNVLTGSSVVAGDITLDGTLAPLLPAQYWDYRIVDFNGGEAFQLFVGVPEPSSLMLALFGFAGLGLAVRRARRKP